MKPINIRQITVLGLCTALIFGVQVALSPLANVELVSLLVIVYTLHFGRKTLLILYLFALLEGLVYGFGLWWPTYLYVWTILWLIATALRKQRAPMLWALVAGAFGLCFGFLCAPIQWIAGGFPAAVAWWIAGIPFDLIHCAANFAIVFVLFSPMNRLFKTMRSHGLIPDL